MQEAHATTGRNRARMGDMHAWLSVASIDRYYALAAVHFAPTRRQALLLFFALAVPSHPTRTSTAPPHMACMTDWVFLSLTASTHGPRAAPDVSGSRPSPARGFHPAGSANKPKKPVGAGSITWSRARARSEDGLATASPCSYSGPRPTKNLHF